MTDRMTSRERVLAAIRRQPVDYVPCAPFTNPQDWPQRVGKRWQYPFGTSVQERLAYLVGELGLDEVAWFGWGCHPDPRVSSRVWMAGDVIHKVFATPAGELRAAARYDDRWPHGLDVPFFSDYLPAYCVEPWVKTLADVERLRFILLPPRSQEQLDQVRFVHRQATDLAKQYDLATGFNFGLGLTGALQMFGPMRLCELAGTDPALVDAYLEVDHEYNLRSFEVALDLGVDVVRRNGFYECCDYFSPAMLERFLARRLQAEFRLVHEAGSVVAYTLLSGITPQLDHLSRLDLDCIVGADPFFRGVDAVQLKAKLGDRKSFWTGPSDTVHMPWDRPDEVRRAVRYVFEVFGKTGLLITPCTSSKAVFPWENFLAMVEEWRQLR